MRTICAKHKERTARGQMGASERGENATNKQLNIIWWRWKVCARRCLTAFIKTKRLTRVKWKASPLTHTHTHMLARLHWMYHSLMTKCYHWIFSNGIYLIWCEIMAQLSKQVYREIIPLILVPTIFITSFSPFPPSHFGFLVFTHIHLCARGMCRMSAQRRKTTLSILVQVFHFGNMVRSRPTLRSGKNLCPIVDIPIFVVLLALVVSTHFAMWLDETDERSPAWDFLGRPHTHARHWIVHQSFVNRKLGYNAVIHSISMRGVCVRETLNQIIPRMLALAWPTLRGKTKRKEEEKKRIHKIIMGAAATPPSQSSTKQKIENFYTINLIIINYNNEM